MYIICPNCNTKFVVSYDQIGKDGRKVRCSKCLHIWHARIDNETLEEMISLQEMRAQQEREHISYNTNPGGHFVPKTGSGVNLPAVIETKIPFPLYLMPVFMFFMIILMITMIFTETAGLNSISKNPDLTLENINIEVKEKDEKITVVYSIKTTISQKEYNIPLVRIRLINHQGKTIYSFVDEHKSTKLSPGQIVTIKTQLVSNVKNIELIDLTLGNKIDFLLR